MQASIVVVLIFTSLLALLIFKYERPSADPKKLTGRGGDFE